MPEGLCLFVGFGDEIEFDLDFELTPSGLGDFERGSLDSAERVGICLMQFELHFFEPIRYVFAVYTFDVNRPSVSVVNVYVCRPVVNIEGFGDAPKN